jgi:hypothetical protein
VSPEQAADALACAQSHAVWLPGDEERWRAYLEGDDEIQVFCPECAEREFGCE